MAEVLMSFDTPVGDELGTALATGARARALGPTTGGRRRDEAQRGHQALVANTEPHEGWNPSTAGSDPP